MKICISCTYQTEGDESFCPHCGTPFPGTQQEAEREQDCLSVLRRNLRHEMTVWRIFGVLNLIPAVIFFYELIRSLLFSGSAASIGTPLLVCVVGAVYLGVSLRQAAVLSRLEKTVHVDCSEAVERASRVRHIVLGAIFNETSWIFAMLNLIHVKNNEALLDQIIQKQQSR